MWPLALTFDGTTGSDGSNVFLFFDDFTDDALAESRWTRLGDGDINLANGILTSSGPALLQSQSAAVIAGTTTLGARLAAESRTGTDLEVGVGEVTPGNTLWAYGRLWDGLTFLSWEDSSYAFDGTEGTACDQNSTIPPALDLPWADTTTPATFLSLEFSYTNDGNRSAGSFETSRGIRLSYVAPEDCQLPPALPILISLDHAASDTPTQRLDYVYVRPKAPTEPSVTVLTDSTRCGAD